MNILRDKEEANTHKTTHAYYYTNKTTRAILIEDHLEKLFVFVRFHIRETGTRDLASNQDADILRIGKVARKLEHIHSCEQHQGHI